MNNKGFTLLEMMGVLILLTVILMVVIPNITNTIKKSNLDQLKEYENTVCLGAKTYVREENVEVTGNFPVSGSILVSKNYISSSLINPSTKKNVIQERVILSYDANHSLKCELED